MFHFVQSSLYGGGSSVYGRVAAMALLVFARSKGFMDINSLFEIMDIEISYSLPPSLPPY